MNTYVVMLRAVNVGGTGKLPIAEFRAMLACLGYERVETYIQSGNAVFAAAAPRSRVLSDVAAGLKKLMGVAAEIQLRTRDDLAGIVSANPFAAEAEENGAKVHAVFLSAVPAASAGASLSTIPPRNDRYHLNRDTLYLYLPEGAADTKFTARTLDRVLGVTATARNLNTVLKLHEMCCR